MRLLWSWNSWMENFTQWSIFVLFMFRHHKSPSTLRRLNWERNFFNFRDHRQQQVLAEVSSRYRRFMVLLAMRCMIRGDIRFQIFYEPKLDPCFACWWRESRSTGTSVETSIEFYPLVMLKHQEFSIWVSPMSATLFFNVFLPTFIVGWLFLHLMFHLGRLRRGKLKTFSLLFIR